MRTPGADPTTDTATLQLTVRYFAAARAAAGTESETVQVQSGTTVAGLAALLGDRSAELARVLARCSYLCDGYAVRDEALNLLDGQIIDVLPPFAGG